jgi:hypothetical protein
MELSLEEMYVAPEGVELSDRYRLENIARYRFEQDPVRRHKVFVLELPSYERGECPLEQRIPFDVHRILVINCRLAICSPFTEWVGEEWFGGTRRECDYNGHLGRLRVEKNGPVQFTVHNGSCGCIEFRPKVVTTAPS